MGCHKENLGATEFQWNKKFFPELVSWKNKWEFSSKKKKMKDWRGRAAGQKERQVQISKNKRNNGPFEKLQLIMFWI